MGTDDLFEGRTFPIPGTDASYTVHLGGASGATVPEVLASLAGHDSAAPSASTPADAPLAGVQPGLHVEEDDGPESETPSNDDTEKGHPHTVEMTMDDVRAATARMRGRGVDEPRGPNAPAGKMLYALKVARKAAPRKEDDEPSVAFIVVASDADLSRILFSARDGRRWHTTFVATTAPVSFRPFILRFSRASELIDSLEFAAEQYPGATVRFREDTGSDLIWHVAYSEHAHFECYLAAEREEPIGWRPPPFETGHPIVAALGTYDAAAMAAATNWPRKGGAAIVQRDETDGAGRKHITLVDTMGEELLRAIIIPIGQTEGLPDDSQLAFNGTLSPPTVADPDAKWRLERRNADGDGFHTLESGTEEECKAKIDAAREGGAVLRLVRPDGTIAKHIEPDGKKAKAEAKRVSAPGKKVKPAPIVHRAKKPSAKATPKTGAKRGKGKR